MTDRDKAIEVMARAAKAVLGEMLGAKPLPPPANNADDWSATSSGQSIDLVEAADRFLTHLQAEGLAVVPRDLIERVVRIREWNHDEYGDACREYDSAADDLAAALPPFKDPSYG